MSLDLSEIKETLQNRRSDLVGNRMLTNELLVDDIMIVLGYSLKRDPTVKKLYNNEIDWDVLSSTNVHIAVKVLAVSENISGEEYNSISGYCLKSGFDMLIITNGETINIHKKDKSGEKYNFAYSVATISNLNEQDEEILEAISKKTFDMSVIDRLTDGVEITLEETKKLLTNMIDSIKNRLIETIKEKYENCNNAVAQVSSLMGSLDRWLNNEENDGDKIENYIRTITELTDKNNEQLTEIGKLEARVDELKKELADASGASRQKALELLELIDDSAEAPRSYVAIINDEIFQLNELHKFVGAVLQQLYKLKSFEANPYIFNGDIFVLKSDDTTQNDLILNNKYYDIMIGDESEDDAITKLKTIFSHFKDIVFECKKLGNSNIKQSSILDKQDFDEDEVSEGFGENGEDLDIDLGGEGFEGLEDLLGEETGSSNSEENRRLLVAQLVSIDGLIWSDEKIKFNTIKYIGNNSTTYVINDNDDEMSYESMVCRCVDAVMALQAYSGDTQTVIKLKQKNLSLINKFIKNYSEEYKEYPRINGTRYIVAEVENSQQVAGIIYDICMELDIPTDNIFIYFDAETESKKIIENYGFDANAISIKDTAMYMAEEEPEIGTAVIRGDMFNNIIVTKKSLEVQECIFKSVLAVKTKYLAELISCYDDIIKVITNMVNQAYNDGINIDNVVGNVIGEQYKVVSFNSDEVSDNPTEINIGDEVAYCSGIKEWQIVPVLVRLHTSLFNNTSIAVKVHVDTSAINYYENDYETSEPSTSLAIKSFADYVSSCIKSN